MNASLVPSVATLNQKTTPHNVLHVRNVLNAAIAGLARDHDVLSVILLILTTIHNVLTAHIVMNAVNAPIAKDAEIASLQKMVFVASAINAAIIAIVRAKMSRSRSKTITPTF